MLTDGAAAYYERKAMGGVASVTTCEGVVDGELGKGGDYHVCLDNQFNLHSLARVAHAIRRHGAVASQELQHTGMYANRSLAVWGGESKGIAYGPVEFELDGRIVLPMTEEIIERTISKFADAAAFAKQCGFGMVTIHAGHGWLLHQFLSPQLNTRKDKWGGRAHRKPCPSHRRHLRRHPEKGRAELPDRDPHLRVGMLRGRLRH